MDAPADAQDEPANGVTPDEEQPAGSRPLLSRAPSMRSAMGSPRSLSGAPPFWLVKDALAVRELIFGSWINLILLAIPPAIAGGYLGWNPALVFALSKLVLACGIPVACTKLEPHTCLLTAACGSRQPAIVPSAGHAVEHSPDVWLYVRRWLPACGGTHLHGHACTWA